MTALAAAVCTGLAALLACRAAMPPPPRLRALVRVEPPAAAPSRSRAWRAMSPLVGAAAEGGLERRLRQAGLARGRAPSAAVFEHCAAVATQGLVQGLCLAVALLVAGGGGRASAAAFALGALAGGARRHARLEQILQRRRERLRIELYTVNQLLTLDVRAGGGVAQALERVARRADGVVAEELRDVLAAVRAGVPLGDALEQAAASTPEPAAGRTYRLLAKGSRFGTDLAAGLRALNEDLRVQRMEAIERAATKRRAAMLLPIIGLLAPVMLLFVAAPLPSIVFGMR